jgi:hypothetical protein
VADAASTYDTTMATTTWAGRPELQLVIAESEGPVDRTEENEARVWRSASIGSVIGFVILTAAITIAGAAGSIGGDIGAASSLGLGAFVGAFGGAGFGFMIGASTALARQHGAELSAHSEGEHHDAAAR